MRRPMSLCIVCIAFLGLQAEPSAAAVIPRGTVELQFGGSYDHESVKDDGEDLGSRSDAEIGLGLARAISDRFMLGASAALQYFSIDPDGSASSSASAQRLNLDAYFNFDVDETVVPFVQLSIGVTRWNDSDSTDYEKTWALPMVGAGLRVLIGESAAVFGLVAYENQLNAFGQEDITGRDIGLRFGVSAFPGGLQ